MSTDSSCPRCGSSEESIFHILRDCTFAAQVWDLLGFHHGMVLRGGDNMDDWMKRLLGHDRSLELGVMCWYLWKSRNDRVFNGNQESPRELASKISAWVNTIRSAVQEKGPMDPAGSRKVRSDIAWEPGPDEWVVLNTDGSVLHNSKSAAAGGLIRDDSGRFLAAFSVNLGRCSITRAELRGLITGLDLAWDRGWRKVAVQCDSWAALALIANESEPTHQHAREVLALRNLLVRDWEVTLTHVFREGNQAADFLAGAGHNLPPGCHLFPITDCNLGYYVRRDSMGISEPRDIPG
ncbi:Putative ribonuclease H protein At1g65750 [Linum perenne]